jgi:DUF4097 and DUF4098 domain-containing protein YvlB
MFRNLLRLSLFVTFVLGAVSLATPCYAYRNDFDHTYPLQPGGTFELQNVNGAVEVQGWDRDEVQIHAVKSARTTRFDLERVSIDVNAKPEAISVATRYPQDEGVEVAVEYTVLLPHTARVEHIGTINGTLRISGVGTIRDLHTVNGNIEIYDGGGTIHARTTNGNVRLELAHFRNTNEASAETTNGSVLLAVPIETQAEVDARSLNGDFRSELPLALESSLHPREVRGRLGNGGGPIRLRTVNGSIRVVALRSSV